MVQALSRLANRAAELPVIKQACEYAQTNPAIQRAWNGSKPALNSTWNFVSSGGWKTYTLGAVGVLIALHLINQALRHRAGGNQP
jgi:hypothetical protein